MKIIIGLGNPGKKYEKTRHNAGFLFIDYLKNKKGFSNFKEEKKFFGEISEGNFNGEKIILLKPQTYMNISGKSVQAILKFYKLEKEDLIIIFDDKDLDFGKVRFREKGSAGGHNGIKDIILKLSTEEFKRIKIGVKDEDKLKFMETSDFVLGNFSDEDLAKLKKEIFKETEEKLLEII